MNKYFSFTKSLNRISITILLFSITLSGKEISLNDAVERVYQAIVRIEVVSESGSGGRMMKSRSTGSGVIIRKDGLIVTNHHVAGKATRLTCRLYDGEEIMADLLGADAMTDLAVLKLRLHESKRGTKKLTTATFANSDQVKVGDTCFAMGSPAGLTQSVTRGIISNLAMISPNAGSFRLDGENVGELVRWLGHDAVIFPGNSGGPLVNKNGAIIGINEVGIGSLGGAIPSNLAKEVSKELAEKGYVSRAWTGLECQPNLDLNSSGLLVSGVIDGSPAEKAGFKPGDIITHFGEQAVQARIPEDIPLFNQISYGAEIGKNIQVRGLSHGKTKKWKLKPDPRESAFAKEKELKSWGITVRNFTLMSSLEARRENKAGAQVHSVGRGGPSYSAKPTLLRGDVITGVDKFSINSISDLLDASRKITRGKGEPIPVLVRFERGLAKLLTVVKIGPEAEENQPLEAWKPWVGISTQILTRDLSEILGLPLTTRGIRIAQVFPETPAEKGGLLAGDLLFRIDGQIIMAHRQEDAEVFGNMIKEYRTDATIQLAGLRNNSPLDLNLTLEKRPPPSNELPKLKEKSFEFAVRELSFADRVNARLDNQHPGLLVENVEPAGWAALAGVRQGDLLLQIDGEIQVSIGQFESTLTKLIENKSKRVIFFVRRGIHTMYLELEPDWDDN